MTKWHSLKDLESLDLQFIQSMLTRYPLWIRSSLYNGVSKASQVLRRLEKMAEKQFIPSIGPIKGKIITGIIQKY